MLSNKYLFRGAVFCSLVFIALNTSAFAASTLSFGVIKDQNDSSLAPAAIQSGNLLEGYWDSISDPLDHSTIIMKIAADSNTFNGNKPGATDKPSTNQTPFYAYKLGSTYYFWRYSDANAPGAAVYVRLWSDSSKQYYAFHSFANGWNTDTPSTFPALNKNDWYKAAKPYVPSIFKFEDTTTTPVNGQPSGSMKVYAQEGTITDGKRQLADSANGAAIVWKWGTDQNALTVYANANTNVLDIPQKDIEVGKTYYFQVIHSNWFGSSASTVQSHKAGAGGGGGGLPFDLVLKSSVPSNGTGINNFGLPFGGPWYIGTTQIVTAYDLVKAINTVATTNVVSTFGQWNKTTQQLAGVMIAGNDPEGAAKTPLKAINLAQGEGYQVYLTKDVTVQIKSTP